MVERWVTSPQSHSISLVLDFIFVVTVSVFFIVKVMEAQEAVGESGRPDIGLVTGGTTLLTPEDMFELLLGQFSHF